MADLKGQYGYALCNEYGDYMTVSTDINDIYRYMVENEVCGEDGEYIREGTFTDGNLIELETYTDVDMNLYEYAQYIV